MLVLLFGIGVGLMLAFAGWATYVFAPRVGPNPIFGVRTGYSMVNRETWTRSNHVGGVVLAVVGLLVAVTGAILGVIQPAGESTALLILVLVMVVLLLIAVVGLVLFTRRLAVHVTPIATGMLRISWWWLAPGTIATFAVVAFLLATASRLPPLEVATHFDLAGAPNDWMSRGAYLSFALAITLGIWALFSGLVVVLSRVHIPGAANWHVSGSAVLRLLAVVVLFVEVLMGLVFADTYWYSVHAQHLFPPAAALIVVILIDATALPAALLWLFTKFRDEARSHEEPPHSEA